MVHTSETPAWQAIAVALGSLLALLIVRRVLINPLFTILAKTGVREIMTAAALLVVLGSALLMELGGLSMAMVHSLQVCCYLNPAFDINLKQTLSLFVVFYWACFLGRRYGT